MNINSASKFSSGCESGWTLYLDQTYVSENEFQRDSNNSFAECGAKGVVREVDEEEQEEEDLSMVSDASSGPPHCHEDCFCENGSSSSASNWACYNNNNNKSAKKVRVKKEKKMMAMKEKSCKNEHHSCLDDTASSPVSKKKSTFSRSTEAFMDNRLDHSQGFSSTYFKGESALAKHFGVFHSSTAKGPASPKPGDFRGGNWK